MGSLLLLGAGSSSTSGGDSALFEIFHLLYKVGSDPASNVYGRHTVTYDGDTTGNFSDYLTAVAAKALFEEVYGEVNVSLINKGYRVTVADPTGDIADPTATPSGVYIPNDGSGSAPSKVSQRDYSAPVSAVQEVFTVDIPATPDTDSAVVTNGSISGGVNYDKDGVITFVTPPSGFTATAGGAGNENVTFTQDAPGVIDSFTVSPGNPGSIGSYTEGVTGVTGVAEQFTVTVGASDGDVNTSGGGIITGVGGVVSAVTNPAGYSLNGGVGTTTVTFLANATGVVADETISTDGTGGASLSVIVQGVTEVTAVAEQFTYTTGGDIVRVSTYSNDGGTTTYTITRTAGLISAISAIPTGFSQFDGGLGNAWVRYAQDSGAAIADFVITSGNMTITTEVQGVDAISEVFGRCVIGFTGAAGYFTFADSFTALASSVAATGADIKSLLNGASGYNAAKVDTVDVTSNSITINYASAESPAGTITIGGRTGAAVDIVINNIQNGE